MSATPQDTRERITPADIRREVLELIGYPDGRGCSVRVSIVLVESRTPGVGTFAKLHIDINEGARKADIVLMLEQLHLPLEEFSHRVLAPVFTTRTQPPTLHPKR